MRYNGVAHVLRNGKGLAAESVHPLAQMHVYFLEQWVAALLDDQAVEALVQFGDPDAVLVGRNVFCHDVHCRPLQEI